MIGNAPERTLHLWRWVLAIAWFVLIASLFYDPISAPWTDPNHAFSPFGDRVLALEVSQCVKVQGQCLPERVYPIGARVFWGTVVPSGILIVLVLGHEFWRRLCPLYFLSQIPRALGLKPILRISRSRWLQNNHLYLQFFLLFLGLNARILFVNSTRWLLGSFLLLTIAAAITIVALYGGRSWCHYVCPFGLVQAIFTGLRGLLGTSASQIPAKTPTQSSCRAIDAKTGREKPACIGCKSNCFDIDAEQSYWQQSTQHDRQFVQYGYLGLVVGYILYYFLYAGNWNYYFSGAWAHEENQLEMLFSPGFYLGDRAISIPKLFAAPLVLALCVAIAYYLGQKIERVYRIHLKKKNREIASERSRHHLFSLCAWLAFNIFFLYGGRPEILRLPLAVQFFWQSFIEIVSTLWLYRTFSRTSQQYFQESLKHRFLKQLKRLPIDLSSHLQDRSLEDLKADELDVLNRVLPHVSLQERSRLYKEVLTEALSQGILKASNGLNFLQNLGQKFNLKPEESSCILKEVTAENPRILQKVTEDNQLRLQSYRDALESLIFESVKYGISVEEAIANKSPQIRTLRREYSIRAEQHAQIVSRILENRQGLNSDRFAA
ncbi:MAG: 4Fe-4S binding protein [Cyanobacteria bacterium P01_E01_bin.42]